MNNTGLRNAAIDGVGEDDLQEQENPGQSQRIDGKLAVQLVTLAFDLRPLQLVDGGVNLVVFWFNQDLK